jgi:hypothetical protein
MEKPPLPLAFVYQFPKSVEVVSWDNWQVFVGFAANATIGCDAGSVPSICPDGDPEYLDCFPEHQICNRQFNCPGGIDEMMNCGM